MQDLRQIDVSRANYCAENPPYYSNLHKNCRLRPSLLITPTSADTYNSSHYLPGQIWDNIKEVIWSRIQSNQKNWIYSNPSRLHAISRNLMNRRMETLCNIRLTYSITIPRIYMCYSCYNWIHTGDYTPGRPSGCTTQYYIDIREKMRGEARKRTVLLISLISHPIWM